MKKKVLVLLLLVAAVFQAAQAQRTFTMPLYEGSGAPTDASSAKLLGYLPSSAKSNGQAVIICPGGGYQALCMDYEGWDFAQWFNQFGIAGFVLQYRMPNTRNTVPLADAEQAMRIVREHATEWGINPNAIGIMGSSAGGHLASTLATHYSSAETRPDFQILLYPVITMDKSYTHMGTHNALLGANASEELEILYSNEKQVTNKTPQCFIVVSAADELVPVKNSLQYAQSLIDKNVPVSLHVYPGGFHGFGHLARFEDYEMFHSELINWIKEEVKGEVSYESVAYNLVDTARRVIAECYDWDYQISNRLITQANDNDPDQCQFKTNYKSTSGTFKALIDRNYQTYFQTDEVGTGQTATPYLQVDLGRDDVENFLFSFMRRMDQSGAAAVNQQPNNLSVYVSNTPDVESSWKRIDGLHEGFPNATQKRMYLSPIVMMGGAYRHVRFVVHGNVQNAMNPAGYPYFNISEFQVYQATCDPSTSLALTNDAVRAACEALSALIVTSQQKIEKQNFTISDSKALRQAINDVYAAKEEATAVNSARLDVPQAQAISLDGLTHSDDLKNYQGIYIINQKKVRIR